MTADRIRFIHSSDWQLGMTRAFLHAEAAARFSQARIDAITTLGQLAAEHEAAFIVVAGDVFESNQISRQTLIRTLDALEALPVPIFLLPGNHDPLDGTSIFATREFAEAGSHIIVLRDQQPVAVPGAAAVEVAGAPWHTRHPSTDLCAELCRSLKPSANTVRIGVAHGQADTLAPDSSRPEIINLAAAEAAIAERRLHYLALGDRHSVTQVGSSGRIWYSGAPVATAFDEVDPNKALLVEIAQQEGTCEVSPLTTGAWSFIATARSMNGPEDVSSFARWLTELPNKERSAVKVAFEGSINLATAAELDRLMESQAELFASLAWRERTTDLAIVPDELDQDSVALSGYAKACWDELLAQAKQGDETARNAMRLFYRLSDQESG